MSTTTVTPPVANATAFQDLFAPALLRRTAQSIRKEVRLIAIRDAVDWIDWLVSIESSLEKLSRDVISGFYSPSAPTRYEFPKSRGAFRVMTAFNIRDAVVYRHVCDKALERATPFKVAG